MKFTKEEISLCKQVAEKHKKPISPGDWYYNVKYKIIDLQPDVPLGVNTTWEVYQVFPLWTISDCLEFLRENIDKFQFSLNHFRTQGYCIQLWRGKENQAFYSDYSTEIKPINKTLLEACLKAVLAVLEEGK